MRGFDNAQGRASKSLRMSDLADVMQWPERDYGYVRMIGPLYSIRQVWFKISTQRSPQGVSIPKMCLDHDGDTDQLVGDVCPFRKSGLGRESLEYWINVIVRDEQQDREFRPIRGETEEHMGHEAHWLKAGDGRLTPVRLLNIPDSQIDKLKSFKKLNKVRDRDGNVRAMDISHPKFGCDLGLLYDPDKKGPAKYDIQKGERVALTREEREYGLFRADLLKPMRLEAAKREMEDLASKLVREKPKDDGGRRRGRREEAPDDPLMEDSAARLDPEDLEDDRPRRRRGRDADLDEDPFEDERPRGRSRARSRDDEDDDEPRGRSRARSRDEDFEEPRGRGRDRGHADLDEDFEDRPRSRSRARSRDDEDDDRPRRRRREEDD